jgi:glycosyltransferase involved in cell wall biosynthesis
MREELLQNGFPGQKVHILPPVVRMKDCAASAIPSEKRVLYVGQLIRGKGVDLLLHALRRLSCDFTATIVGAGNAQGKLEALCRGLGLGDKVQFRGWVSHEEVSQHYADAKVVVVPSRWPEPFGMIGLEAMHHGRPVVAFRVGGIPDWLEDHVTGLLVPEQDVDGLARSVEQLLMDTELAERLGRKAYERVRDRFSFDEYVTKLESHLRGDPLPAA